MALIVLPACEADSIGSVETIALFSSAALIASAFYGIDGSGKNVPCAVAADRKSLTITVVANTNFLTVTLFSLSAKPETATLYQGDPQEGALADIGVADHNGVGILLIQGT